jgi:uncharacterized protein YukE
VPGIERVAKRANVVNNADTGNIRGVRDKLQSAADEAGNSHQEIVSSLQGWQGSWTGGDADAFGGYINAFTQASKAAKEHLDDGIAGLDEAIRKLDEAKDRVDKALDAIAHSYQAKLKQATAAKQGANPPGQVTEGDKKKVADEAIAEHEQEIESAVGDAEKALQSIADKLDVTVHGLDGQFSVIKAPATGDQTSPQSAPVHYNGGGGTYSGGGGSGGGGDSSGGGGGPVSGGMGASGGPPSGPPPGNVDQWIREAIKALRAAGYNVTEADIQKIWSIIQHESGGDPNAINNWDSNAAAGTPSKGLMQCIDPTFQSHALPGHGNIWNPVDNICAGVAYTIDRYGSLDQHPGIASMAGGGGYQPY